MTRVLLRYLLFPYWILIKQNLNKYRQCYIKGSFINAMDDESIGFRCRPHINVGVIINTFDVQNIYWITIYLTRM